MPTCPGWNDGQRIGDDRKSEGSEIRGQEPHGSKLTLRAGVSRQGTQVLVQGRVQPLVKQIVKRFASLSCLRFLQRTDIRRPVLRAHGNRWISAADKNEVHQQPRGAPIAVVKRVDVYQPTMRGKRGLWCVWSSREPFSEVAHKRRDLRRRWKFITPGFGPNVTG